MSFYIFGDTHGLLETYKVTNLMNRIDYSEDDYIIICGDVGVAWDHGRKDREVISILSSLKCTVLFIDGNHENHPLLRSYPSYEWNGGLVHEIANNIFHLERGYVFT